MEMLSFMVVLPISFSVNKHSKYNDYFMKIRRIFDLELVALRKARNHHSPGLFPDLIYSPVRARFWGRCCQRPRP